MARQAGRSTASRFFGLGKRPVRFRPGTALVASSHAHFLGSQVLSPLTRRGHVGLYTEALEPKAGVKIPLNRKQFERLMTKRRKLSGCCFLSGPSVGKYILNVACFIFSCMFWCCLSLACTAWHTFRSLAHNQHFRAAAHHSLILLAQLCSHSILVVSRRHIHKISCHLGASHTNFTIPERG